MSVDPIVLGATMVGAAVLGVARAISLSQRAVDNALFARVMIRLAQQGQRTRAEKLLSAMPKAAYAQVLGAGLASLREQPDGHPEPLVRSEVDAAIRRARDALDPAIGRWQAWDAVQAAVALGPAGWAVREGIVLPGWAWAGLGVAVLSLVFSIRKRRAIAAIGPELAAPIVDALLTARKDPPAEPSAYRAPAPPVPDLPPAGEAALHAFKDGRLVGSVELPADGVVKLGRARAAGRGLELDAPEVARMHAVVERDADAITVTDLGSETGTFVNGERINRAPLREGDRLGIGPFELRLALGAPAEVPPAEPAPVTCAVCGKSVIVPLEPLPADWASVGIEANHCLGCGHVALRKSPRADT